MTVKELVTQESLVKLFSLLSESLLTARDPVFVETPASLAIVAFSLFYDRPEIIRGRNGVQTPRQPFLKRSAVVGNARERSQ